MKRKILIVDDDDQIRNLLMALLRNPDFEVDTASNGEEALKLIENKYYDLVITDYDMPKMNGEEFLKNIKKRFPNKNSIGITSTTHEKALYRAGADLCIHKPFTLQEINSVVSRFINDQYV